MSKKKIFCREKSIPDHTSLMKDNRYQIAITKLIALLKDEMKIISFSYYLPLMS